MPTLKDFKTMTPLEKKQTIASLRARKDAPKKTNKVHSGTENADLLYQPDEREFLRAYIQEEISAAKTLNRLNEIYEEHFNSAYVIEHRRAPGYTNGRAYTETRAFLINQLRARAEEIYQPKASSPEMEALEKLKEASNLVPEKELEKSLETLLKDGEYEKQHDQGEEKEKDKKVEQKPGATRSLFLYSLLIREKELPTARFASREHDKWIIQALKALGSVLYAPIGWVYHPTVYSKADKAFIREHLNKEIEVANTFQDLMDIYDRYKDAEFVKERRYGALLENHCYSKTRTKFIERLRKRAVTLDQEVYNPPEKKGDHESTKSTDDQAALDPGKAIQERGKLLRHPIFATAHEGTPKLGGVSKKEREALDESQKQQSGQINDKGVNAQLAVRRS